MLRFSDLVYTLASLYYRYDDTIRILKIAGINPIYISLGNIAINNWTFIVEKAENQNKLNILLKVVLEEHENPFLKALLENPETDFMSPYTKKITNWMGSNGISEFEKITQEQSTLLPISFLSDGLSKAKSVVRVITERSLGSGFLIGDQFILTNNHVINNELTAAKSTIQFNYQKDENGALMKYDEFSLSPENGFYTSRENDWTAVKIKGFNDENEKKYGKIMLKEAIVKKNDFVNIIQHPGGEHKQIALYHNVVVFANDKVVQYLTDTLPGSSGAPVFNSKWEVVALHHSGGNLIDQNSGIKYLRNEGILINLVISELKENGINF